MTITVIALLIAGIQLKNMQMIFLTLMNFSLLMYTIAMTGIGSAYLWNSICTAHITSRIGYTFSALGFCFLEIFYLRFFNFRKSLSSLTIIMLFAFSLIFSVLILLIPNARTLMAVTICVLIFGLTFITIVNMSELAKNREPILFLVSAWLPLFCYVIFRQTIHLLRIYIHIETLEQIFDCDYYFGYQICFISNFVTYGIYILKKSIASRREFAQYRESVYFLRSTAHELLSPITLIENAVERLESNENERHIAIIKKNCERIKDMTVLANSLEIHEQNLDTLMLENCPLNLNSELRKSLESFEFYSSAKQIKIESDIRSDDSLLLMAHPVYLETVFINLIDNAIKYSGSENIIRISLDYESEGHMMIFQVESPRGKLGTENLEEIFEFGKRITKSGTQADGSQETKTNGLQIQGFGIGLHLTRRICRLYKGDCTARLNDERVIFSATMQMDSSTQQVIPDKTETQEKRTNIAISRNPDAYEKNIRGMLAQVKILLVEDNLALLESMKDFLSDYCIIRTASNAEDALVQLSETTPRLIISDILLPGMDGESLYHECRKSPALSHIPFIFLTGIRDNKIQKRVIANGATDYLLKPFSNENLLLKIYATLNRELESEKKLQSDFTDFLNNRLKPQDSVSPVKNKIQSDEDKKLFFLNRGLSEREIEIAFLLAKNKTNKEIGETLFISVSTVATHVQHIYNKCRVKSRTEFISLLLENTLG
jgi:DNA-binding NarL/FixJ family response regulator/signal transduction histidine kinase